MAVIYEEIKKDLINGMDRVKVKIIRRLPNGKSSLIENIKDMM